MSRSRRATTASLGALGLVAACGQLLGVNDYRAGDAPEGGPADADEAPFSFADAECGSCMMSSCSSQLDTCANDDLCRPWQMCMASCETGDGECEHVCFVRSGRTNEVVAAALGCAARDCEAQCGAGRTFSIYGPACADHILDACADQVRECRADPACNGFVDCVLASSCVPLAGPDGGLPSGQDPACLSQCGDRYGLLDFLVGDGGTTSSPLLALTSCVSVSPAAECGAGDLACGGNYRWPVPSDLFVDVTLAINNSLSPDQPGSPVPDTMVRACPAVSVACDTDTRAVGPIPTDAHGRATLTLPTNNTGLYWYFEFQPGIPDGPAWMLYPSGRRLTQDTVLPLSTAADFSNLRSPTNAITGGFWPEGRGAAVVFARNCQGTPLRGFTVRVDGEDVTARYVTGILGWVDTPSEDTGVAVALNLVPGVRRVEAWIDGVEVSALEVVVREDSVTFVQWLYPPREPDGTD